MNFDPDRAHLNGPEANGFRRFRVPNTFTALEESGLKPRDALLIVSRGGEELALSVRQMTYHHVAQGILDGEHFVVTF